MADDLYEALIGGGVGDKRQLIADALRRRRKLGELGVLTGDKVLSAEGKDLNTSTDKYLELLQGGEETLARQKQTKAYQDSQLQYMNDALAETKRNNNLDYLAAMAAARAAQTRAERPVGSGKSTKLTLGDRNKLEEMSSLIGNTENIITQFKPEYTQKAGPGGQSRLVNWAAANGVGTKEGKEAADWWGAWNLIYTLPQRNKTFGATLSDSEKQSWTESDINPGMGEDQIKRRAGNILKILKNKGGLLDRTYRTQFDPEIIDQYGLGDGSETVVPGAAQAVGTPKRIKVDAEGNIIGN